MTLYSQLFADKSTLLATILAVISAKQGTKEKSIKSHIDADCAPSIPPGEESPARLAIIPAKEAPKAVENSCKVVIADDAF